jgi:uncharacterized RDD family membrane protein YckC
LETVLDNVVSVQLPEGVSVDLVPAGIAVRAAAYLIDYLIRFVVMAISFTGLVALGSSGTGLLLVIYFFVSWLYYIVFELRDGQTPGKKRLGIRVVQDSGLPAGFSAIILRNLLRGADVLPFGYFLGLCSMVLGRDFKRLGDRAAGTRVVYQSQHVPFLTDNTEKPYQLRLPLTTDEQSQVMRFAERSPRLSDSRRQELSNHLADVLQVRDQEAVERLRQMARYYAG